MGIEKIKLEQRIELLSALRHRMVNLGEKEFNELAREAGNENNWFVPESIQQAFNGIKRLLERDALVAWSGGYELEGGASKNVGVVMAGNIPMVGFHDLLCVVISGHHLRIKPSSSDTVLMRWLVNELYEIEPALRDSISFEERLNEVDAIIATGSDNSARYFEYYFAKKPHIIRKNRTSCAILTGDESGEELSRVGQDVFSYFGLGCRNVSKLFLPRQMKIESLLDGLAEFEGIMDHHKYKNNYDYNKSIYLVNGEPHFDNGFLLLRESDEMVSPISVAYFAYYNNETHLQDLIEANREKIQCIAGRHPLATVSFGQTQFPEVADYADDVDTLLFLDNLSRG